MTDRPIIFSAPMIRALIDGRKTQTRRVVKASGDLPEFCGGRYDDRNDPEAWGWEDADRGEWITLDQFRRYRFVPYAPGDRLWVRERWSGNHAFRETAPYKRRSFVGEGVPFFHDEIWYWADESPEYGDWEKPRPSIHMPRWASRLTLTVTDVHVQRLQEISEADVAAEGITRGFSGGPHGEECLYEEFADLWNSIHGPDAWDANPWVVALSFDVHCCNIDQMEFAS